MTVPTTPQSSSQPDSKHKSSALPPGMVMGPDGKPCKICTAFRNWKPGSTSNTEPDSGREKARVAASQANATRAAGMGAFAGFAAAATATGANTKAKTLVEQHSQSAATEEQGPPKDCPADVEVLGRATWTFLHSTAAYYPEKPTPTQRANMLMLLRSLPVLYPCSWCATDFGKDIDSNPPDVSSREKLSLWLCQRHNEVNQKLGKEKFDCAKVDERWKDGPPDGRCD